ncbi:MAG TPA: hypothetical protein VG733_03935 [Chthoniobacteraceae bacterium]|nr:hypothetical protein [Chthoniobacteraceae bacterium]
MKIAFYGMALMLACLVLCGHMDAARTPTPTPTPPSLVPPIPPEMTALRDKLWPALSDAARGWAADEAVKVAKDARYTEIMIRGDVQNRFTGQGLSEGDKSTLLFIILNDASKAMGDDLMTMANDFVKKAQAQHPNATPPPDGNVSITLAPQDMQALQTVMQRRATYLAAMTTVAKRLPGLQVSVVGSLK